MFSYEITESDRFGTVVEMKTDDSSGRLIERREVFHTLPEAHKWISEQMHTYLHNRLVNYVSHSRHIMQHSRDPYYRVAMFEISMRRCLMFLNELEYSNLFAIAKWIRDNKMYLKAIIPAPGNNSHAGAELKLKQMFSMSAQLQKQQNRVF